ncbi:MAG: VanZ family protein [Clostridia bacterium]|nr:VanZ family protein [Clostridia bacterium]
MEVKINLMYLIDADCLYLPAGIVWLLWLIWTALLSKKYKPAKKIVLLTVIYIYILMVFAVSIFPLPNFPLPYQAGHNFIPFYTIIKTATTTPVSIALKQLAGNIIMFIPFGFLISFFTNKKKFVKCIASATLFSVFIEFLQFILGVTFVGSQYRVVDIDDVILNLLGAIIGFCIFKITPHFIKDPLLPPTQRKKLQIYRPEIVTKKRP